MNDTGKTAIEWHKSATPEKTGPRIESADLRTESAERHAERTYTVTWEISLDAESAVDAARKALRIHRNPESIATVFVVESDNQPATEIDLDEVGADG
jgi:hypothetical protein